MTEFSLLLTRTARMRSSVAIVVLGLIAASLFGASMAGAAPFLSADAGDFTNGAVGGCVATGPSTSTGAPVSSQVACGDSSGAGSARATASIGKLGAEARVQEFGSSLSGLAGTAIYSDTVVFSGPGNDPVLVRMNLHFAGSLDSTNEAQASATARAIIDRTFVGVVKVAVNNGAPDCVAPFPFSGLGTCGFAYDTTLQSALILVAQDIPIQFQLDLEASAGAFGFSTSANSLFSSTFGFIVDGPVFDLPEGFTANSPTSFIVNNRFVPPDVEVPGPGPSVPGPSSVLLLTSALGLVAILRRCRA